MLKRLLNRPEEITHLRLKEACAANGACVFAKVRIADVLPIEGSGVSGALFRYALQAHFDFVVTDERFQPLFAVEFDGPGHLTARQGARDAQKDGLCDRFEFPILRVNDRYLPKRYRDMDLLTWFVQVWFAEQWFTEAQEAGHVPFDEPFMPQSLITLPGLKNRFPLWLSATVRVQIHNLHTSGQVRDLAPSQLTGRDAAGRYHALSFIRIDENRGVIAETGMRSQRFPVSEAEALDEIVPFVLYEKLSLVLAGRATAEARSRIEARVATFVAAHRISGAFHVGGSFAIPEFRFSGTESRGGRTPA